jgi:hypothetical protein
MNKKELNFLPPFQCILVPVQMGLYALVCSVIQDVLHLTDEQHTDSEKLPTGCIFFLDSFAYNTTNQ